MKKEKLLGFKIMLARKEAGLTQEQLAQKIGVKQEMLSRWESKNVNISLKYLQALAKVLNKPVEYFLSNTISTPKDKIEIYQAKELPEEEVVKLPILGAVPCNNPDPNIETYMLGEYEVRKSIIKGKKEDYFVLKATSDSMIGEGIKQGDVLIVKRQPVAEDGDIVIAWVEGEGVTCKRFRKTKTETYLEPANEKYKPIKNKNFIVYGKVIYKEGKV